MSHLSESAPKDSAHPTDVASTRVDPASKRSRAMFETLSLSSVGLEFGLSVIIGLAFGRWLDGKAGTDPWLMILFLVFGFAAGIRAIYAAMKKADRQAEREAGRG